MKMKMKNISHRHEINRRRHGHLTATFAVQFMKKLSNTEARLKKVLLIKKVRIRIIFTDTVYTILYNLHCEIQLTTRKLSCMQCSKSLTMVSFHFHIITSKHVFKTQGTLEKTYFQEWSCLDI